jgi:hypothetical protein
VGSPESPVEDDVMRGRWSLIQIKDALDPGQ